MFFIYDMIRSIKYLFRYKHVKNDLHLKYQPLVGYVLSSKWEDDNGDYEYKEIARFFCLDHVETYIHNEYGISVEL